MLYKTACCQTGGGCKYDDEELEDFLVEENMRGLDKLFPCGPTYEYNGKTAPCLVEVTPNGSIILELLAKALKHTDQLELFFRSDGICPFLLLDGHGSHFELPCVEYITDPAHEWTVCICVLNGTIMLQVGDSI
jgi:hypothetical protein